MKLYFSQLISNTIELTIILLYFNLTLGTRRKSICFNYSFVLMILIYSTVNMFFKPPLPYLLTITIITYLISTFYPKSRIQKLAFTLMYLISSFSIEAMVFIIASYLNINFSSNFLPLIICNIIRIVILFLLKRIIKSEKVITDDSLLLKSIVFSIMLILLIYYVVDGMLKMKPVSSIEIISIIVVIFSILIIIYLMNIKHESNLMQAELLAIKRDNEAKKDYYNKITEYEKKISTARHDLINRITAILVSSESNNVEEQLRALANESASEKHGIYTDNILINYVLNNKLNQIEINQENTHISICLYDDLLINPGDTGVVLGNILDNATEALSHITLDKRRLLIDITLDTGVLNITVENTYDPNYKRSDNRNRGYGLRSIKEIVENYGGYLLTKNGDVFTTRAVMINTTNVGKIV